MAIQDDNTILNKGDLKAYHQKILPYLGGNMMVSTNNSDYYSTEEKVVGVWIDGKPLYQKTLVGTISTTLRADTLLLTDNSIERMVEYSGVAITQDKRYSVNLPNTWEKTASSPTESSPNVIRAYWDYDLNSFYVNTGQSTYLGGDVIVTLQYTKTTDTAGSAITTPGAYDINFPNTWPANTEIYFGNGLYGYRATGNFTATATNSRFADTLSTTLPSSTRIVSSGGNITATSVSENQLWDFPLNSSAPSSTENFIQIPTGLWFGIDTKQLRFGVRPMGDWKLTTSNTYDVWVTYTK